MSTAGKKNPHAQQHGLLRETMKTVYDLHVVAYADVDADLRLRWASPGFALLMSEPASDIEGQRLADLIWEFAGVEKELTAVLQRQKPLFRLSWVNRKGADGRVAYFDFTVRGLEQPEPGLLFVAEDVTFRGELQQQLHQERNQLHLLKQKLSVVNDKLRRLDRLKTLFLSMAAHDLRTPLTAISGYTGLIMKSHQSVAPQKTEHYLTQIQTQCERLQRLTNDILNLGQIEQGQFSLQLADVELNDVVRGAVALLRYQIERRSQEMRLDLADSPINLQLDRRRMEQVLYNLINNAIKYTPEEGKISISTRREGETAVLQIADTGIGVTQDEAQRLFQLYYRTDGVEEQKIQGTGLGLYIVRQVVVAHGGQIDVESEPGAGTVFTVKLPL